MDISNHDVVIAFKDGHDQLLKKIHLKLNAAYFNMIFSQNESDALDNLENQKIKNIENICHINISIKERIDNLYKC